MKESQLRGRLPLPKLHNSFTRPENSSHFAVTVHIVSMELARIQKRRLKDVPATRSSLEYWCRLWPVSDSVPRIIRKRFIFSRLGPQNRTSARLFDHNLQQ